jgi:hypothetical protein
MANMMKKMTEWEEKYHDVTELYALADDLLKTVPTAADPQAQLDLVETLVEALGDSADILSEEYINLCEGKKDTKATAKSRIEGALRKTYIALHEFTARASDLKNAAHSIVKKVKRQLEQVISNFMEFVTLSLDRIMQKQDVEELKQRHAHLALMLHQVAQQGA